MSDAGAIVAAAGLSGIEFEQVAYAPPLERERQRDDLPAILAGKYRGSNAAIRAWPRVVTDTGEVTRWDALAFVSQHPALALDQLTVEERERLRAESQVAQGLEAPVGQEAVLDQPPPAPAPPPDPKPYAPPIPALDEDLPDDDQVTAVEADCGYPGCMQFSGPQGTQVVHVEGCQEFGGGEVTTT